MLALIFLPVLAFASDQKFQRPMHWLPYPSPDYLRHQVIPYEANRFRDGNLFTQPTQPLPELGGDPQGRLNNKWKLKNALDVGYLFGQFKQYQQYPQYYNPHQKTVTLVVTTTINVTTSQSCIPATQFANFGWSMSVVCTHSPIRKKRGVLQESSAIEDLISIEPSDPEQLVMTTLPGDVQLERRNRHLLYDPDLFISSSKDDVIVMDEDEPSLEEYPKRENRLYYFVATTTVVTFLVNTFTTLKKISLAFVANLVCRPSEIPVCME